MTDFAETPEFKKAVAQAASEAVTAILAEMQAKRSGELPLGQQDQHFAGMLANQLAELTDQGTGRRRVAPEIMRARSQAAERMTSLILQARENRLVPSYKLKAKVYLDETIVDPMFIDPTSKRHRATEIDWPGVPSEAMIPLNEAAQEIYAAFLESIGSVPKEVAQLGDQALRMTAGGLVVKGAPRPQRDGLRLGDLPAPAGQGLRIKGRGLPGESSGETINVLGTLAAPARVGAA